MLRAVVMLFNIVVSLTLRAYRCWAFIEAEIFIAFFYNLEVVTFVYKSKGSLYRSCVNTKEEEIL